MKTIITALSLAIIGLLCGCANLPDFINPPRDPTVASTDAALQSAPTWVNRFLKFEEANPELMGMDARTAAEALRKRFGGRIGDLQKMREAYVGNRTDDNASRLRLALETVLIDQGIAQGYLSGTALRQRGLGAPFAPPLVIGSPGSQPTALDNILERLDGIHGEQVSQRAELTIIRTNLGRLGHAVWSMTNKTTVTTNAPPKKPNE